MLKRWLGGLLVVNVEGRHYVRWVERWGVRCRTKVIRLYTVTLVSSSPMAPDELTIFSAAGQFVNSRGFPLCFIPILQRRV